MCSALLSSLNQASGARVETALGTWESLLEDNECQNHAIIFPVRKSLTNQRVVLRKPAHRKILYVQPDAYRHDASIGLDAPWEEMLLQEPMKTSDIRPHATRPRLIDRQWIDLDLPKAWLQDCLRDHGDTCSTSDFGTSSVSSDLILVDTVQSCLVRHQFPGRYLALSYVWGQVNNFHTMTASFRDLCKTGSLDEAALNTSSLRLPRTIRQAMKLTRAMGQRYIWIDSLCIVQDGTDKIDQINAMASIFSNALLTIVAQGVDADAGINGLRNISEPRDARQYVAPLSSGQHLIRPSSKHVWDDSLLQPWSTRAWTFQESVFSRRALQFAHGSVRWCCRKARWSEESESLDCLQAYSSFEQRQLTLSSPQLSNSTLPMLEEYEALVNGFNIRKLTYAEDALSAFAGISARLGTKFSGGLISGLPEFFFDVCLLWRPTRRLGPVRRRHASSISAERSLPSWSWAGWDSAEITLPYTWNRHQNPAGPLAVLFGNHKPFYQINMHTASENGELIPVNNSWFRYACGAVDEQLPPGWYSSKVSDLELEEYGNTESVSFFQHSADPAAEFWFPVPENPTFVPPRTSKTLHFETTSGRFRLGETRRSMTRIHTLDSSPAGTLWQHDEDDEEFLYATSGPLEARRPIELVAVLGCTIPRDDLVIWDPSEVSMPKFEGYHGRVPRTEVVYNVMWIHREGKKSYRKATGVVSRSVWDAAALSRVKLYLE